jgi:O-antigen ligase/tetratricopeptide (TPR) repeat protein
MTKPMPYHLLALALILSTLIGGQVITDSVGLSSDTSALVAGFTGNPATVLTTRLILAVLLSGVWLWHLATNRVHSTPHRNITVCAGVLFLAVSASVLTSPFKASAFATYADWLVYLFAFYVSIAVAGRKRGPILLLTGLFIGGVLLAVMGIREYADVKAEDPSWRIFAGWVNPNATAAMLMMTWFAGLAVITFQERIGRLLALVGTAMIGLALLLTQSKGALIVVAVLTVAFILLSLLVKIERSKLALPVGAVVLTALLGFGLVASQRQAQATGAVALTRVADSSGTSEQSAGFRTLLWKGSIMLLQQNAIGSGLGAYRYESARSKLHTQTVYAHNSWLQMAVESSVLAPLALLGLGLLWLVQMFRGLHTAPDTAKVLRLSMVFAVVSIAGHSLIDSDLSYFGIGLAFFVLLGSGLSATTDAIGPDYVRDTVRVSGAAAAFVILGFLTYLAVGETAKNRFRAALSSTTENPKELVEPMLRFASYDGEAYYLAAQYTSATLNPDALSQFRLAAEKAPTTRNLRALARAQESSGNFAAAIDSLYSALRRDPNNLPALLQLLSVQDALGDKEAATRTAQRLVAVEATSYFTVRAIPELIPTETAEARVYLAKQPGQPVQELLQGALRILEQYRDTTVPTVAKIVRVLPDGNYGGENAQSVDRKLKLGISVLQQMEAYGTSETLSESRRKFEEALANLAK